MYIPEMIHPNTDVIMTKQLKSVPIYENQENSSMKLQSGVPYQSNTRQTFVEENRTSFNPVANQQTITTSYREEKPLQETIHRTTYVTGKQEEPMRVETSVPSYKY